MARPLRQGAGGKSTGGRRVAVHRGAHGFRTAANDNRLGLKRLALRVLTAAGAIALMLVLIRYVLG